MHALTIQYFEILQVNRVKTSVVDVERCLYVPFEPIADWSDELLNRYRANLLNAALNVDFAIGLLFPPETTLVESLMAKQLAPSFAENFNQQMSRELTLLRDPHWGRPRRRSHRFKAQAGLRT